MDFDFVLILKILIRIRTRKESFFLVQFRFLISHAVKLNIIPTSSSSDLDPGPDPDPDHCPIHSRYSHTSMHESSPLPSKEWIRGVNIGGWLVLERYITPYFFALTSCDLRGDFRFFPHQIDAPPLTSPNYKPISEECLPVSPYPVDEWTLTEAFQDDKQIAARYLDIHYQNFLTFKDIKDLKANGVTHLRVPLGHWILGDIDTSTHVNEPYVQGGWKYFRRLVDWCRQEGLQVWPDLHTAPGSQNGFDNSGHLGTTMTCHGWDQNANGNVNDNGNVNNNDNGALPPNVQRTLRILQNITATIAEDQLTDVITGFGILNEPFSDCDMDIVRKFYNAAFEIVRTNIGPTASVYASDMFDAGRWNDGFWTDESYKGTYLDSHIYHSFESHTRDLSPKQHIALVCTRDHVDVVECCYNDDENDGRKRKRKRKPKGIERIFSEWSASFDQSVGDQVQDLMDGIAEHGVAERFDQQLSKERKEFLRNFVEAQMVSYEAVEPGESKGWFYWNFKIEGGIFAEWDFLRGVREGWIPKLPEKTVPSQQIFGSCYDILNKTKDDWNVVHEIPSPSNETLSNEEGNPIDDDVVLSHGSNLRKNGNGQWVVKPLSSFESEWEACFVAVCVLVGAIFWVTRAIRDPRRGLRRGYIGIDDLEVTKGMKHVGTAVNSFSSQD